MDNTDKCNSNISDKALVQSVYVASPCDVGWDSMQGDDRKRFCGQCKLNVYNTSFMSTMEIAELMRESEDRVCIRLYKRFDGTIITADCPVGLRKIRDRIRKVACNVVAQLIAFGFISSAQAQGLIGAPVDGRGRYMAPDPKPCLGIDSDTANCICNVATYLSCLTLICALTLKKGQIAFVGTLLLGIWALAGFAIGVCYR
jgi:hypothetical protein